MMSLAKQVDFKEETWEYKGTFPLLANKRQSAPSTLHIPVPRDLTGMVTFHADGEAVDGSALCKLAGARGGLVLKVGSVL